MMRAILICAAAALVLSGCTGGETGRVSSALDVARDIRAAVQSNRVAAGQSTSAPRISRAVLDQLTVGALEVTLESRDLTAILVPAAFRSDAGPGRVAVWATVDGAQVILRDGVLYATRGLGRDLAASDVSVPVRAVQTRGAALGARSLQLRGDDFDARNARFQCTVRVVADTSVTIVERSFAVRHLRETCSAPSGEFINDYYVDSAHTVRQSRQWAGPNLGYLRTRLLKK